jgi:hypothetical protein
LARNSDPRSILGQSECRYGTDRTPLHPDGARLRRWLKAHRDELTLCLRRRDAPAINNASERAPGGRQGRAGAARAERQRWYWRGFRFRAGIEGRISVPQRRYGLDCCRDHGEDGMDRWIGWGIVTGNLERIARTVAARPQASVACTWLRHSTRKLPNHL